MTSKINKSRLWWHWGFPSATALSLTIYFLFKSVPLTTLELGEHRCFFTQPQFSLSWHHSVEKQPWLERYERRQFDFLLLDTQFKAFGAGTPDQGQLLPAPVGYIRFAVQQPLSQISWIVSRNVQSTLWLDTKPLPLYQWSADYDAANFQVQHWPWWKTVLKDSCDDYALKL